MVSMNFILLLLILPPILLMAILVPGKTRYLLIFTVCGFVSAYVAGSVNSVIMNYGDFSDFYFSIHFSPAIEELMKGFPLILYIIVARPSRKSVLEYGIAIGLGFTFFENAWAFANSVSTSPSWQDISFALSRGFGASMVHSLCTCILGYGFSICIRIRKMKFTGTIALFSLVCIFHSLFNVLIQSRYFLAPFILTIGAYTSILIVVIRKKKKKLP